MLSSFTFVTHAAAQEASYLIDLNSKTATDLGTLSGTSYSFAYGINDAGQVAGGSLTAGGQTHAFITGPDGMGMRDLGTLGGTYIDAPGINHAAQMVGTFDTASGSFITDPNGVGMRDLGTLSGNHSFANGINDAGQVVGTSDTVGGDQHAFITGPNGMSMTDLGTLGDGNSIAYGINDAGQVAGRSYTASDDIHAFITGPGAVGMMDLNSLVDLPTGLVLTEAKDINNPGQVIAFATIVPEPKVYALILAGLAMIGVIAQRKKMRAA